MQENANAGSSITLVSSSSTDVSILQRCLWLLNIVYYQILAMVTVILFWIYFEAYDLNATRLWHLVFSTVAYIPLMAAGFTLFSEDNITTLDISRTKKYTIHGILLFISFAAITAGISVETDRKRKAGTSNHFTSNHAILGLVSWILIFVSVLIGLVTANTTIFSRFIRPIVVKLTHNFLGLAAFAIGIGSLYLMLSIVERNTTTAVGDGTKIGIIFITIYSGLAALKSLFSQLRSIFS